MSDNCTISSLLRDCALVLKQAKAFCVTAESCTGGGIAHAITSISGSSEWFERGFVTYSNQAKMDLLGVPDNMITEHGAVSEATAKAMAEGALKNSLAGFSVSVTGIAGPDGGSKAKPVGTVWIAWAGGLLPTEATCYQFEGDREAVREQTIFQALSGLYQRVLQSLQSEKAKGRYFFALWPDDKTSDSLFDIAEQVVDTDRGKLTQRENLHLTLVYLGHISTSFLSHAKRVAREIKGTPFSLQVDGVNDWSNVKVRYLSLTQSPDPLERLVSDLNQALLGQGFKPERRAFVPHITVARRSVMEISKDVIEPVHWPVNAFHLVCANGNQQKKYQIIQTVKL